VRCREKWKAYPAPAQAAEALHDNVPVREHCQKGGILERGKLKDFDEGQRLAKGVLLDRNQLVAAGPLAVSAWLAPPRLQHHLRL
jgi:hypothetical protein